MISSQNDILFGSNAVIEMALEDFGIDADTYKTLNKQTLERVTNNLINLSDASSKEQMLISQSIILENRSSPTKLGSSPRHFSNNIDNRRRVSFAKQLVASPYLNFERPSQGKRWNKWAKEYENHLVEKLCMHG